MNGMTILWILVAAAVAVIGAALVAGASSRAAERRAEKKDQDAYERHHRTVASQTQHRRTAADDVGREQNLWPDSEQVASDWAARERPVDDTWDDGTHPHDPRHSNNQLRS